jgi:pimeloyl-ACP methyl ester carboxylesterase
MATFQSGGLTLAYDDIHGGDAGTAVLVHGFATNRAENWKRLSWYASFERKGYRVAALDLRGHGESEKPHDPAAYARADMVGDVIALMDHLGLGRVDLVGYSMGSHLSLRLALTAPDRVANLILGGVGGRMLPGAPQPPPPKMTMREAMTAADPASIPDKTMKGFRQFADNQGDDKLALAACSEGAGAPLDPDELYGLRMPVLVVAGSLDEIAGDPQALADAIPGAKAVTLPACDHFSAIPHALFKASVFDFLEGWLDDDLPAFE